MGDHEQNYRYWPVLIGAILDGLSLEAFQKTGLGGVEITLIYGVFGKEEQSINYLTQNSWSNSLFVNGS